MKTSYKIFLAIFILILISSSFYAYTIYRQRNPLPMSEKESGQNLETETDSSSPSIEQEGGEINTDEENVAADNSAIDSSDEDSNEATADEKNNFLDVSKSDCDNNCNDFSDKEDLKYCQQVCGITGIKKDVKEKKGCDALEGLEKDYCLKDLAINKRDIKICGEIEDTDIKKVCQNRITQDFLDSQNWDADL